MDREIKFLSSAQRKHMPINNFKNNEKIESGSFARYRVTRVLWGLIAYLGHNASSPHNLIANFNTKSHKLKQITPTYMVLRERGEFTSLIEISKKRREPKQHGNQRRVAL